MVKEIHKVLTSGTYDERRYIENEERPGEFKKHDYVTGVHEVGFYTADSLNKLAFMCATGSGKTLIMHANILQFQHYFKRAQEYNKSLTLNKIILLTPNEGLSTCTLRK